MTTAVKEYGDDGPAMARAPALSAANVKRRGNGAAKHAALDLSPAERLVATVTAPPVRHGVSAKQAELENLERAIEEARRERPTLQELAADARRVLDTALVRARAKPSPEANDELDEARAFVRQTDDRITENERAVQLLETEARRARSEVEALQRAAHGVRRRRVLERLEAGKAERRERLFELLVEEDLEQQMRYGAPPSDVGRLVSNALGERVMAIAPRAQALFDQMAQEIEP